jgi:hypothetical protein
MHPSYRIACHKAYIPQVNNAVGDIVLMKRYIKENKYRKKLAKGVLYCISFSGNLYKIR